MPSLDEDGWAYLCDRCGERYDDRTDPKAIERCEVSGYINQILFKHRPSPFPHQTFCLSCLKLMMVGFHKLRDIDETIVYINYLQRSISAIRNKDYWPNANDAGKGGIERLRRNIRDRARISAS